MKQLTMRIEILKDVLINKVTYLPHPQICKGNVYVTGAAGKKESDDSCILINPNCRIDLSANISIGRYVYISNGVNILTHDHDYNGKTPLLLKEMLDPESFTKAYPKEIEDDVWIFKSIILAKCQKIAKGVIIGVESVVTKNIEEEYSIWAGNPAKKIGHR